MTFQDLVNLVDNYRDEIPRNTEVVVIHQKNYPLGFRVHIEDDDYGTDYPVAYIPENQQLVLHEANDSNWYASHEQLIAAGWRDE